MAIKICVFDAYGTLFDVAAAARRAAAEPGNEALAGAWPLLADTWRAKQLQYTWIRAITGAHADFWQVTQEALDFAMEAHTLDGARLRERLLQLYWELDAYPDAEETLTALAAAGIKNAILSNGSPDMLNAAVASAGIGDRLDAILSVETVGVFKPNRAVYDLVGRHFGVTPNEVAFVSSNGWDAAGAAGYGFHTVWANRANEPVDRLPWRPTEIASDLRGAKTVIEDWAMAA